MQRTKKSPTAETIVITKWIALKGSSIIAREKEEELLAVFSPYFLETVNGFEDLLSPEAERELIASYGIENYREVKDGGVYGALWDLSEARGGGIEVNLRDIPVKQETIEIANYFDIDPYLLFSCGSFLFITDRGYELVRDLNENGVNAAEIGIVTDNNDRVIINNGSRRFLTPRYKDEITKVLRHFATNEGFA